MPVERNEILDDLIFIAHKSHKVSLTHPMPPGAWHHIAKCATIYQGSDEVPREYSGFAVDYSALGPAVEPDILEITREVARDS